MKDATEIVTVIDKSGSMGPLVNDTIEGFNYFLKDQQEIDKPANITLVLFDTLYTMHDPTPVRQMPKLDAKSYTPSGCTALLDAVGRAINDLGARLLALQESERPANVIFVIITDGEENSSREFKLDQVASMIKRQQETYNWDFVFLGANIDAFSAGRSLGIAGGQCMGFEATSAGVGKSYAASSRAVRSKRMVGAIAKDWNTADGKSD